VVQQTVRCWGLIAAALVCFCGFGSENAAMGEGPAPGGGPFRRVIVVGLPYPTHARGLVLDAATPGGERGGFAREVVQEAAAAVGIGVQFVQIDRSTGEMELLERQVDAVAGMSVQAGRMKGLSFSAPLMVTRGAVWVKEGKWGRVRKEDLRKMWLAVATDGLGHQWGIENRMNLVPSGSLENAFENVENGKADGVVTTQAAGRWEIATRQFKGFVEYELDDPRLWRAFAIAVRAEDSELLADLNAGLAMLRYSGRYDQLYDRLAAPFQPRQVEEAGLGWRTVMMAAGVALVLVISGVVWAVTLRRQLGKRTKELRASEAQYRTLTENIPGIVYSYFAGKDGSRRTLYESPSLRQWKEWFPGLEVGGEYTKTILPHIHQEDRERYRQMTERARAELCVFDIEYRIRARQGDIRWVHAVLRPIRHDDGVEWQGLSLDVTRLREAERVQGEMETKFREIFDHSHEAILVCDPDNGAILEANQRAEEMYGYPVAELRGLKLNHLVSPGEVTSKQIRELLLRQPRCEFVTVRRRSDGSKVHVEVAASLIRLGDREVVLSMDRDVGERIAADAALKSSERRYREFVVRSTEGVYRIENRHGISIDASVSEVVEQFFEQAVITECNDAMAAMYGYESAEAFAGTPLKKVMDPANPANQELIRRFVASGLRLADAECSKVGEDGTERWFRKSLVGQVENGLFVRTWGIQREETQQRLARQELADAQARLAAAVTAAGICTWKYDLHTGCVDADANYLKFHGFEPGARPTREAILKRIHPDDRKAVTIAIERAIRGSNVYSSEHRIVYVDEQGYERVRWMTSRGMVQRNTRGQVVSITGACTDITESKVAAEEREQFMAQLQKSQKLESMGVMAGGVAHDFNNILVGIMGSAGLAMSMVAQGQNVKETLETIERAAGRAADLTKQLLAYSGRGRVVTTSLCITELVRECAELLTIAAGTSCRVVRDLKAGLPLVSGDPTQLSQVLLNLVRNAAEALPPTGGEIVIRTGLVEVDSTLLRDTSGAKLTPGTYLCLSVSDNGAGMSAETRSRIFEPFFTTKFTGRGLGLSSVLGIIQAHGGAVQVKSAPGKGTTFDVYLPQAQALSATLSPKPLALVGALVGADGAALDQFVEARETAQQRPLVGDGTILVVDDEKLVRDLVCAVLRHAGYQVEQALDGFKALELVKANPKIRLTILDMTMPTISGEETMNLMQVLNPQMAFLLTSGYADALPEHAVRRDGLVRFLAKPYRNQELLEAVASMLSAAVLSQSGVSA
jgi:PAS domain S-box-containing protein